MKKYLFEEILLAVPSELMILIGLEWLPLVRKFFIQA